MKRSVLTLCSANLLLATVAVAQPTDRSAPISEPLAPSIQRPSSDSVSSNDIFLSPESPTFSGGNSGASQAGSDRATFGTTDRDATDGDLRNGRRIEVINERYESGKVRVRREVTLDAHGNYVQHGTWTMYDRDSTVIARGMYDNNERQGDWMRIHDEYPDAPKLLNKEQPGDFAVADYESFQLPFLSNAVFNKGHLDGPWIMHDADDKLIFSLTFSAGHRDGSATWFYPDGDTKAVVEFREGIVDGIRMEYNEESQAIRDEKWESGRKLAMKSEFQGDNESVKRFEAMYLHSPYVVDTPDDWWSGRVATYHANGPEDRHGPWASWHDNGQKKLEGTFENDQREGEFTWWYSNGQIRTKGQYRADEPVGRWVWYHENGQKATYGNFRDGRPHGYWSFWETSGQLANRVDYSRQNSMAEPPAAGPVDQETTDGEERAETEG